MLGKKVYFIDCKARSVKEGVILSHTISQSGYEVNIIFGEGQKHSVENARVFECKEDALEKLPDMLEIKDEMDAIEKESTEKLNEKRVLIIGQPEHKELADELFGK